jgi:NAD(P)-dependent dehydrogenase (short-subunit alcohol dehydrogenase family)
LQVNLAVEKEIEEAFKEVLRVFGRIDYAVNNAAVPGPFRPTAQNTLADLDKVLAVNLKGLWLCERAEVRLMEKQDPLPSQAKDFRFVAYLALPLHALLIEYIQDCEQGSREGPSSTYPQS